MVINLNGAIRSCCVSSHVVLWFGLMMTAQPLTAAEWYLDARASAAGAGISWTNAWRSTTNIDWASIKGGDTLWIQGGNYGTTLSILTKTKLTVRIAPDATEPAVFNKVMLWQLTNTVIDGLSDGRPFFWVTNQFVHLQLSSNVVLRGLHVNRETVYKTDTAQIHGFWIWNQNTLITLDSCIAENTTGDGFSVNQLLVDQAPPFKGVVLTNCSALSVGDDGVQLANGNATVVNCTFDTRGFGTYFGGHPDGLQLNPDGHTLRVERCYFKGFNQYLFVEYARSNIYILNNIFFSGKKIDTDRGLTIAPRPYFEGDFVIANNVFAQFLSYSGISGSLPPAAVFANNVFYNCRLGAIGAGLTNFITSSNFWWEEPGIQYYSSTGEPMTAPYIRSFGKAQKRDPKFIDPNSGKPDGFRLQADSPCTGAGTNLTMFFDTDFTGARRTEPWDIGAFASKPRPAKPAGLYIKQPGN